MGHYAEQPRLRAYLLRFWEVRSHDARRPSAWRFSLEDPHTGDKYGFPDFQALVEFLEAELASSQTQVGNNQPNQP